MNRNGKDTKGPENKWMKMEGEGKERSGHEREG